jgi:hypothetical protein
VVHEGTCAAHELIQRGLEHYARGRLREAVQAWEDVARFAPQDRQAGRLLAFAYKRMHERDARRATQARHDTLESPIPGFLASLTAVEADEESGSSFPPTPAAEERGRVDTRRVVAGLREPGAPEAGQDTGVADDTWKEFPIQDGKLEASARGLVDECEVALREGRAEGAGLAAELALQLGEQANSPEIDGIVDPARPLFERAFCACIGDTKSAPIRAVPAEELAGHGFDHRAAFLMSRMDGVLSVSDLLDIAGMPRFDALRLIAALRRAQAVDLVPVA